jgi:hypothetical protein
VQWKQALCSERFKDEMGAMVGMRRMQVWRGRVK